MHPFRNDLRGYRRPTEINSLTRRMSAVRPVSHQHLTISWCRPAITVVLWTASPSADTPDGEDAAEADLVLDCTGTYPGW